MNDNDIVSVLDRVHENLSEVDCGVSDNGIDDNQESDDKSNALDGKESDREVALVVSRWCDVKWQVKFWLLVIC